jgi:alpha-L-fucosidase 2
MIKKVLQLFTVAILLANAVIAQNNHAMRMWYNQPAKASIADIRDGWENDAEWLKALPLGNGFLGAMVFGDVNTERIQLNEKSLWSGSPDDNDNPDAYNSLDKIRQLLWQGKYKEASELTLKSQVCKGVGSGNGNGATVPFGCFQTLGDLMIDFRKSDKYTSYHRELDMTRGVVVVTYQQNNIKFKREIFISYPDRALVMRLTADKKGALSFSSGLTRPERYETHPENGQLLMTGVMDNGKGGNGMQYAVRLKAVAKGGERSFSNNKMEIKKADEIILFLTASTNYKLEYPNYSGGDPKKISLDQISKASSKPFATLLKRHVDDFSALFEKVSLNLTHNAPDTIPTDIRLENQKNNSDDFYLQEIYFQFGRYLMISSSREGSLPANLQGIWANKIQTPWNGDYHTDINVQMNYWLTDVTNLSECYTPLIDLIESLVKPGEKTATVQYKANGWCVHPITNVWGFTSPGEQPSWGMHLGAGGWLCQHLWDHYTFTLDKKYLKRVYPIMLKSAQFYLDWLVKDPNTGKLVSGPAASPENSFSAPDGSVCQISMGPSHDQEIIHELFANVLKASLILNDANSLLDKIKIALKNLATPQIGSDGRLMEWGQEYAETEPGHRHMSHLYGLYPASLITPNGTPELAQAARKSLEFRLANGGGGTGWSRAWLISLFSRLEDGDQAYKHLVTLLSKSTLSNLFDSCPPFQIDGNFGATAGITEMLMQSQNGYIELLPALPSVWKDGEVKGLVARGGFVVDIKWKDNQMVSAKVYSRNGGNFSLKYKGKIIDISNLGKGRICSLNSSLKYILNHNQSPQNEH